MSTKEPNYLGTFRMAPPKPPAVIEEHYRVSTIADRFECSEDYVMKELKRYESTGGKEGLGPSYLTAGARVIPASAVLAWRERSRVS